MSKFAPFGLHSWGGKNVIIFPFLAIYLLSFTFNYASQLVDFDWFRINKIVRLVHHTQISSRARHLLVIHRSRSIVVGYKYILENKILCSFWKKRRLYHFHQHPCHSNITLFIYTKLNYYEWLHSHIDTKLNYYERLHSHIDTKLNYHLWNVGQILDGRSSP